MSYINREEAIRLIMEYQGGAMDKPTAKKILAEMERYNSCTSCRYNHLEWDELPCDSCTSGGESNHWKPSVQPEPLWIPCSERLPVKMGNYLVTTSRGGVWAKRWDRGWCGNKNNNNIKAWMPLPEPYKEDNNG